MNLLETWVQSPGADALVWTLIHSLWEGALVALALAAALCVLRGARARYAAACLALVVMLAAFGMTFANLLAGEMGTHQTIARTVPLRPAPVDLDAAVSYSRETARGLAGYLPWIAPFWLAGVLVFHLRSLAGWVSARRLRRTGVCCAPAVWQRQLQRLAARLRISAPVTLWESCLADVPLVIGFARPVILMPVGLLAGMPAAQVEALLLHELAHIRRYDYLVNLLQVFVEGLVFYHPAVWWMAAVIRAERENCCDDLVVATQGDAYQYASALTALEQTRGDARQPVLAATGGSLVKRIRRLLAQPETSRSALTPVLSAAVLAVTAVAVLAAWQTAPRPPSPSTPAAAATPVAPPVEPEAPVAEPAPAPRPAPLFAQQRETAPLPMTETEREKREAKLRNALETPYRKWLNEDVAYIVSDAERAAFKLLTTDAEREYFIQQFWLRRDPTPDTPVNEYKEEHYRRIAYTNQNFSSSIPGWKTDRGRIYITYGPSDEKEVHPSGGASSPYPYEQWLYRFIDGVGKNIIVEFVDAARTGDYRMTADLTAAQLSLPPDSLVRATTVQMLAGKAVISIPLRAYLNHRVTISVRILTRDGSQIAAFEDSVQAAGPAYVKTLPVAPGEYRLVLTLTDVASGKTFGQTTEFSAK